jgi:hypothetical protein
MYHKLSSSNFWFILHQFRPLRNHFFIQLKGVHPFPSHCYTTSTHFSSDFIMRFLYWVIIPLIVYHSSQLKYSSNTGFVLDLLFALCVSFKHFSKILNKRKSELGKQTTGLILLCTENKQTSSWKFIFCENAHSINFLSETTRIHWHFYLSSPKATLYKLSKKMTTLIW